MGVGSPDADDLSTLKAGEAADHRPAERSGGIVGEYEEPIVLAGRDGAGERRLQILCYFYLLGGHYPLMVIFASAKIVKFLEFRLK